MTVIDGTLMNRGVIKTEEDIETVLERFRQQGLEIHYDSFLKTYIIGAYLLVYEG